MILTISTTHKPATDLGFLLHKNPARVNACELSQGRALVVYPEASENRCTAAVILDIDPVGLVRGRQGSSAEGGLFDQYVNDRPYAVSSLMSVALGTLFGTAMSGRSKERQELADQAIPLEVHIPVLPCKGGSAFLRALFEPLGYEVESTPLPLDPQFSDWGDSRYLAVTLRNRLRMADLLSHLYVLIPVLDDQKHYWLDTGEVEKLLRRGKGWLEKHPEQRTIARRYLRHQRSLFEDALARLVQDEEQPEEQEELEEKAAQEEAVERPLRLHDVRLDLVARTLQDLGAKSVLDLGCGDGKLLKRLLDIKQFTRIVGMDVSFTALEWAKRRLRLDRLPERQAARIELIHGSLVYRDKRLENFDAAAVVEVIEHLDPHRLASFELVLFKSARPAFAVVTTPNREYNPLFEGMAEGAMRHRDHRFEWTRQEFSEWAERVAAAHGYSVELLPVGPVHEVHGAPTQMAVFRRLG